MAENMAGGVGWDDELEECQRELNNPPPHPVRFVITGRIGAGAYGCVFSAHDLATGHIVAVKRASAMGTNNESDDHGIPVTLIRETGLLQSLRHPNVVNLRDKIIKARQVFLVFELCSCNLTEYINELKRQDLQVMPPDILRALSRQILAGVVRMLTFEVCAAVAYCHERRIIHRDLKPDNILLDEGRRQVKVADFGLARAVSLRRDAQYTGMAATIWYRPPEIMLGSTSYGTSVDIWSMGCIVAQMATFKVTLEGDNEVDMLMRIFQQFGTPNEETWPGVTSLPYLLHQFPQWSKKPFSQLMAYPPEPTLCDLVEEMLQMFPPDRITALEASLYHPFFNPGTRMYQGGARMGVAQDANDDDDGGDNEQRDNDDDDDDDDDELFTHAEGQGQAHNEQGEQQGEDVRSQAGVTVAGGGAGGEGIKRTNGDGVASMQLGSSLTKRARTTVRQVEDQDSMMVATSPPCDVVTPSSSLG